MDEMEAMQMAVGKLLSLADPVPVFIPKKNFEAFAFRLSWFDFNVRHYGFVLYMLLEVKKHAIYY
jgi:hypothetical protein